jgi:hypothetical protein
MNSRQQTQALYEDALAEERILWNQLHAPLTDVNEEVKAFASWSAAAERARHIAARAQDQKVDAGTRSGG